MSDKTLSEIYEETGISRRAIQGYEKAGLIRPTGKNERGHLLYDERMQERIRRIRLFQQMHFSVREIGEIIDAPKERLVEALEGQIEKLKSEVEYIEKVMTVAREIIGSLRMEEM